MTMKIFEHICLNMHISWLRSLVKQAMKTRLFGQEKQAKIEAGLERRVAQRFCGEDFPTAPAHLIKPWNPVNKLMTAIIASLPFAISDLSLVLLLSMIKSQKHMQLGKRGVRRPHYQHSRNDIPCVTSTIYNISTHRLPFFSCCPKVCTHRPGQAKSAFLPKDVQGRDLFRGWAA